MRAASFAIVLALVGCHPEPAVQAVQSCEAFRLPYPAGLQYDVLQGNGGSFSHFERNQYAWDFAMPQGAVVAAAGSGAVVDVIDGFTVGGLRDELRTRANTVVIDHGRGVLSQYLHLAPGTATVRPGQLVVRGTPIAKSGHTGFSSEPHLHFEFVDPVGHSLPGCLGDVSGGVPKQGSAYVSANRREPSDRNPLPIISVLPSRAFELNGVELQSVVPARMHGGALRISGRALWRAPYAIAFIAERGGGTVRSSIVRVTDASTFELIMNFRGVAGPYRFGLALMENAAQFLWKESVPVFVVGP